MDDKDFWKVDAPTQRIAATGGTQTSGRWWKSAAETSGLPGNEQAGSRHWWDEAALPAFGEGVRHNPDALGKVLRSGLPLQQAARLTGIMQNYDRRADDQELVSKEFPSQEALNKYLQDHPRADKSKHRVKKSPGGEEKPTTTKEDPFEKQWGDALESKLGRKPTKEDFVVLKGKLTQFVQKNKDKDVFDNEDAKKPDPKDPFVQQWGEALETQLGRKPTREDIDVAKGKMMQFIQTQRGKEATIPSVLRVASRFLAAYGRR